MTIHVGLDVGSRNTAMAWRQDGRSAGTGNIVQTPKGRKAAVKKLLALNPQTIVMEATGIYYLDLAVELAAAGLPVSVINPKRSHNFAKLMLQHSKTDAIDAQLLAEYGERMAPSLWTPPREPLNNFVMAPVAVNKTQAPRQRPFFDHFKWPVFLGAGLSGSQAEFKTHCPRQY